MEQNFDTWLGYQMSIRTVLGVYFPRTLILVARNQVHSENVEEKLRVGMMQIELKMNEKVNLTSRYI